MDFVTKKQFEDALKVIEKAIAGNQLVYCTQAEEDKTFMRGVSFTSNLYDYGYNQLTFLAPDIAIQNNLHELRKELKMKRDSFYQNQKELESLEVLERKLVGALAVFKEQK